MGKSAYKYVLYAMNDDMSEIVVKKKADKTATYDDFLEELDPQDCCYAVYDFDYDAGDAGKRNKLVFFVWAPDTAKIKKKMVYAASKDAIRKQLLGIHAEIQATAADETEYDTVLEKVM